jgi:hypothetical protein
MEGAAPELQKANAFGGTAGLKRTGLEVETGAATSVFSSNIM